MNDSSVVWDRDLYKWADNFFSTSTNSACVYGDAVALPPPAVPSLTKASVDSEHSVNRDVSVRLLLV